MSQSSDFDSLARRFLDLWQDQVAATAADPALAELMARMMATSAFPTNPVADSRARDDARADAPTGSTTAASASGAGGDRMEQLARRVAACEERLSAVESRLEPGGGGPGRASRRSRR